MLQSLKPSGFTLIEILIVMVMLAFVASLAIIVGFDSYHAYVFRAERNTLVMALQDARSQAVNNICLGAGCSDGKAHGVEIENNQYVIFQGTAYNPGDSLNEAFAASSLVSHNPAANMQITFTQLSGTTTAESITLSDGTRSDTISVNSEGRIDW